MEQSSQSNKYPIVVIVAAIIIIIAAIKLAASFVTLLLLSVFIGTICVAPIRWLRSLKVPNGLAIGLVFIGIIGIFVGLGQIISASLSSFSENLPEYEKNLNEISGGLVQYLHDQGINISVDKISGLYEPSKIMGLTAQVLGQLGNFMGNALIIFFLALFLLMEVDSVSDKMQVISRGTTDNMIYVTKITHNIRHYLSIKTVTSLLTGISIWIGLAIIGVDYAILWALLAFLLNYIPNIGSIIAGIPPVLFAAVDLGVSGTIWTLAIFIVVNLTIGNVVEPKMMGRGMGLSTFVVLISLIFWGFVMGTVGMFLAIPLTMAIKIILEKNSRTEWIAVLLSDPREVKTMKTEKE